MSRLFSGNINNKSEFISYSYQFFIFASVLDSVKGTCIKNYLESILRNKVNPFTTGNMEILFISMHGIKKQVDFSFYFNQIK